MAAKAIGLRWRFQFGLNWNTTLHRTQYVLWERFVKRGVELKVDGGWGGGPRACDPWRVPRQGCVEEAVGMDGRATQPLNRERTSRLSRLDHVTRGGTRA